MRNNHSYVATPYHCSSLMSRTAEEVPWQLQRADLKKELYHTVLNVDILLQLYSGWEHHTAWLLILGTI